MAGKPFPFSLIQFSNSVKYLYNNRKLSTKMLVPPLWHGSMSTIWGCTASAAQRVRTTIHVIHQVKEMIRRALAPVRVPSHLEPTGISHEKRQMGLL